MSSSSVPVSSAVPPRTSSPAGAHAWRSSSGGPCPASSRGRTGATLFRFHVGRPLLASLAAALPGSAARRRPLVWDRGLEPPPNPAKVRRSLAELQRLLPSLPPLGIARRWAGYIDAAPDLVPVLGEVPQLGGFVLATGFSGHGFALGPVAGRLVSELILDGKPSLDLSAFRFSRFAEGVIGTPRNVL